MEARSESKAPQWISAAWHARKREMCKRAVAGLQPLCPKSCCTKLEQSKEERREPSRERLRIFPVANVSHSRACERMVVVRHEPASVAQSWRKEKPNERCEKRDSPLFMLCVSVGL